MENRIPVLIDCDPGVDDAHALLMALSSPRLEVRAITTVAGNMPLWLTTANALRVTELAGVQVPVSAGCAEALYRSSIPHSEMFHGKNGLGNATVAQPTTAPTEQTAVETMRRELERADGALHIIALGPLTNVAFLIKLYPHLKEKIAHLTIMGGGQHSGNITEHAEFNFYCDGEAADVVMRSGLPITLADLDGCESAHFSTEDAGQLTDIPSRVSKLLREMWDFNLELSARFGEDGFTIHDSIAVASVIDPDILRTARCNVTVVTDNKEQYGKSIVTKDENGTTEIAEYADKARFFKLSKELMEYYPVLS